MNIPRFSRGYNKMKYFLLSFAFLFVLGGCSSDQAVSFDNVDPDGRAVLEHLKKIMDEYIAVLGKVKTEDEFIEANRTFMLGMTENQKRVSEYNKLIEKKEMSRLKAKNQQQSDNREQYDAHGALFESKYKELMTAFQKQQVEKGRDVSRFFSSPKVQQAMRSMAGQK
jgi:hypothetical protein